MKRSSRLFNASNSEVGWISTTDMFVVSCCFLLFLMIASKRRASEFEDQLQIATEQLEISKAAATPGIIQKLQDMANDHEELDAQLNAAREQIADILAQRLRETAESSKTSEALLAMLSQKQTELNLSRAESNQLKERLEVADQQVMRVREQALSQQRSLNNKLVGLGGKLENVVFMVDVSKSMKSGKQADGLLFNNWFPIVEVIERWINGLDVASAALIVFGDNAEVKVQMQDLNQGGRERILNVLKQIDPSADGTNFLAAFEEAYRIPNVDTIIVFSDGLPSIDVNGKRIFINARNSSESDQEYQTRVAQAVAENVERVLAVHRRISEIAKQHPTVAVNVIGLGEAVYNEKTGNLLNDLALDNGGVFLSLPSRILEKNGDEK
jgi:hypothetical protein